MITLKDIDGMSIQFQEISTLDLLEERLEFPVLFSMQEQVMQK